MYVTAFDWHDFARLYRHEPERPFGSCILMKKENQIDCRFVDGTQLQFPSSAKTLSQEIQSNLPLQLALMESTIFTNSSAEIAFSGGIGTEEFKHMASDLVKCYRFVSPLCEKSIPAALSFRKTPSLHSLSWFPCRPVDQPGLFAGLI